MVAIVMMAVGGSDSSEDDYRDDGCRDNSSGSDRSNDCDARWPGALAQQAKRWSKFWFLDSGQRDKRPE